MNTLRTRLVTTFYRRATLMMCDVRNAATARAPGFIAPLMLGDTDAYMAFRPLTTRAAIQERRALGDTAYVAWVDNRIVHAAWVSVGCARIAYLDRQLPLAPDELFVHDSFTLPAFRRRGIAKARMTCVFDDYARRGFRRCFAIVAVENESAAVALRTGGYLPVERYSCIRFGGRMWRQRPR